MTKLKFIVFSRKRWESFSVKMYFYKNKSISKLPYIIFRFILTNFNSIFSTHFTKFAQISNINGKIIPKTQKRWKLKSILINTNEEKMCLHFVCFQNKLSEFRHNARFRFKKKIFNHNKAHIFSFLNNSILIFRYVKARSRRKNVRFLEIVLYI